MFCHHQFFGYGWSESQYGWCYHISLMRFNTPISGTSNKDTLRRFVFENTPIRGNTVHLSSTIELALEHQDYPKVLRYALGELMAAASLLAATLKMQGALILQIQGSGPLKLLVVECTDQMTMRATAKWNEELTDELPEINFIELIGSGQFVITLDPKDGNQAYQGVVALEGANISQVLQNYMLRSEQIETRIWLACDDQSAAGLLLQKLPDQPEQDMDAWNRISLLADTVHHEELLGLPADILLQRLFHEEDVRLFESQPVAFHCSCSRNGVAAMLRLLGQEEVRSIIEERGKIEVHCDFCNQLYEFDQVDAEQLFTAEIILPASDSRH